MNLPKVSIIIPAYNCERTIGHAVASCLEQRFSDREVIVVDDGSTDTTGKILKAIKQIKTVRQDNRGPAAARNRGAHEAGGEFLVFTDSDCRAHPDWIEKLLCRFSSDRVGAVAGSYGIMNDKNLLARCIHQEILFRHSKLMKEEIGVLGSYNFAIKKELFVQLHGFDESYREASGEDNDLSYRITHQGKKILFAREALVDHWHTASVKKYLREQFRHGFWRAKMYLDHPRMAQGDNYTFWKDAFETLVSFVILTGAAVSVFIDKIGTSFIILLAAFFFFEIIFGFIIQKRKREAFFYGYVMFLRSFARAFGLASGFLRFIFAFRRKKT